MTSNYLAHFGNSKCPSHHHWWPCCHFYGFSRATEDVDIAWLRSPESGYGPLQEALNEIDAQYIGNEIDPATGIEKTHPVTFPFVQNTRLMMLLTRHGFLDLFDYVPGIPEMDVNNFLRPNARGIDGLPDSSPCHCFAK